MHPNPWESSDPSCLVLLAYCLFQMLWAKLHVLLLCIAVIMTHFASLYLTVMVDFFYQLWQRRLQAGRQLIRLLSHKLPEQRLVPISQALWDSLYTGRTWYLGVLYVVFSSAQRNAQRLLIQLRNELGKSLYHAVRWTHCSQAIAYENTYQVILRAAIHQLLSTLFLGCSERLQTAISQGMETVRALQFLACSTQQHPGPRSATDTNEAPTYDCPGNRARVNQCFRRPNLSNLHGHFSASHIPAPPPGMGLEHCQFFTPGVSLNNTRFHANRKMDKKTKKNEDEKEKKKDEKKEKNVKKEGKEKKEKKEEMKVKEKGGEKEVKEEKREKEKVEKKEEEEEVKEEVKVEEKDKIEKKREEKTELRGGKGQKGSGEGREGEKGREGAEARRDGGKGGRELEERGEGGNENLTQTPGPGWTQKKPL